LRGPAAPSTFCSVAARAFLPSLGTTLGPAPLGASDSLTVSSVGCASMLGLLLTGSSKPSSPGGGGASSAAGGGDEGARSGNMRCDFVGPREACEGAD